MDALAEGGAYCAAVVRDVAQDEALRRAGAHPDRITTGTWRDLRRAITARAGSGECAVAAFAIGCHALLVADTGFREAARPDLSAGTLAVSCCCDAGGQFSLVVLRDGRRVADGGAPGRGFGVAESRRAQAGADFANVWEAVFTHDLELLCRVAGVRPTLADLSGLARIALVVRRAVADRIDEGT
ncbi:hypothetical protein AB0I54_36450 [Streptomyces sp. NPDC050625]|uniref:hypothetical protein n=1 Tax=Streptomyces sp. NPDC050625 TaxID=3154629 RepID=UPI0034363D5E